MPNYWVLFAERERQRERERESKAEQTAKQGTERAVTMAHFPFWDTTSEAAKFE